MKIAERSTLFDKRTLASIANNMRASLASHTAPGRRIQRAIPAATPTLVTSSRRPRRISESDDRAPRVHTVDAG
jgi:hypothetical protein